eukprot:scaffold39910_cov23-Tisochrysis_lutea.AAC.1
MPPIAFLKSSPGFDHQGASLLQGYPLALSRASGFPGHVMRGFGSRPPAWIWEGSPANVSLRLHLAEGDAERMPGRLTCGSRETR